MQAFDDLRPGQREFLTIDFSPKRLADGVTLDSGTVTIEVLSGTDASPNDMLDGDAEIVGTKIGQWVIGADVDDVHYALAFNGVASDGSKPSEAASLRVKKYPR